MPKWGIDRMKSMIRERTDWCISRQRRWGLPIPVVYCQDCGKPVVTDETIAAISALFAAEGSNAWFEKDAAEILPAGFTCPHCGGKSGFDKEEDTLDWTSTAGGSRVLCSPPWAPSARARPLRSASPTAGLWTARAGPCTSPWATAWTPPT